MDDETSNKKPERVQLSRARGWRLPENTVKVDRSTAWGNPFRPGDLVTRGPYAGITVRDGAHAAVLFREWALQAMNGRALPQSSGGPAPTCEEVNASLATLRGESLACWCRLGDPCHADVLLELANGPGHDD
jgi:hypothetical protein